MTQADRDRLVALKKAKDKKMTQRQAAEELQITERQVRRLLVKLRKGGDKQVLHGLRGRSNRKIKNQQKLNAIEILSGNIYKGFGPTLACEYLEKKTPDRGEQGNGAKVDARSRIVAGSQTTSRQGPYVAG